MTRTIVAFDAATTAESVDDNARTPRELTAADGADGAELVAAQAGDEAAFSRLFRRHSAAVFRYAWLLTGSESVADDVTQDAFMKLLDARGFDPQRGSLAAYLCGIARHLALRADDQRIHYVDDVQPLLGETETDLAPMPQDEFERQRATRRLYEAIRRLPASYRDVLILVELQEMSYADAAVIAGIELGTVRSRLARAKARLAQALREEGL